VADPHDSPLSIDFLEKAIDQFDGEEPLARWPAHTRDPLTKVGGQCVEVEVQGVAASHGDALRRKMLAQIVDKAMRRVLGPCAQIEYWNELADGVNG
jgi:hypothetical protein